MPLYIPSQSHPSRVPLIPIDCRPLTDTPTTHISLICSYCPESWGEYIFIFSQAPFFSVPGPVIPSPAGSLANRLPISLVAGPATVYPPSATPRVMASLWGRSSCPRSCHWSDYPYNPLSSSFPPFLFHFPVTPPSNRLRAVPSQVAGAALSSIHTIHAPLHTRTDTQTHPQKITGITLNLA